MVILTPNMDYFLHHVRADKLSGQKVIYTYVSEVTDDALKRDLALGMQGLLRPHLTLYQTDPEWFAREFPARVKGHLGCLVALKHALETTGFWIHSHANARDGRELPQRPPAFEWHGAKVWVAALMEA